MSIRWKLLLLLLAIALPPLLVMTSLANRTAVRLGQSLGDQARQTLTVLAKQQLEQLVEDKALLIGREANIVSLALQVQARQVERCLATDEPGERVLFTSHDYDVGEPPGDLQTSPEHVRVDAAGNIEPIAISRSDCVFTLPPGVARDAHHRDMLRLAAATPIYQQLHDKHGDILQWHFTALENGVHCCYPGHGGYPSDYDARQRRWYVRTRTSNNIVWTLPYTDITTGRTVLTAAIAVHWPDGKLAGVTGIDVTVSSLMQDAELPRFNESQSMVIALLPRQRLDPNDSREMDPQDFEVNQLGLFLVAEPGEQHRDGLWHSPQEESWLMPDNPADAQAIIADMREGRGDVRQIEYMGHPTLWAYGPIMGRQSHLLVIVPAEQVVADAVKAQNSVLSLARSQAQLTAIAMVVVSLIVVIVALAGSRSVTRPVRLMAEAARRVAAGDFEARARVRRRDELGELSRTFNRMVPQLQDRMRIRQSLTLAMEVQQNLLPSTAPKIDGLDIAGRSIYCDETGGDYFDFIDLADTGTDQLGIAVGDVSGHGVSAALLMTTARALLRGRARQGGSLSEMMQDVNRLLTHDTPVGRYMTLFYAVIDRRTHSMRWTNAGHDPAICYDPRTGTCEELNGGDLPLGILPEECYEEFRVNSLAPGQVIVIGTDGIWETRNAAGQQFGKDALKQVIQSAAASSADQILQAIVDALEIHRAGKAREDDVTLVVTKIL